ncbi:hypothetical protein GYB22_00320 [bacterium]|nr:hypothetical protein [bacterium]
MKNLIFLFSICFLFACGNKKAVVEEAVAVEEEEVVEDTAEEMSDEEKALSAISKAFTKAIVENDLSDIQEFYPNVEVAKALAPKETEGKTADEIKSEMLDPLVQRFETNVKNIQTEMEVHKVNKSTFSLVNYKFAENDDPTVLPRVLSIEYDNNGTGINIPVTVAKIGLNYYVFEILNTQSIFH